MPAIHPAEGGSLCSLGIGIGYNHIYALVWVCPKMEYTSIQYTPKSVFSIGKMTIKTGFRGIPFSGRPTLLLLVKLSAATCFLVACSHFTTQGIGSFVTREVSANQRFPLHQRLDMGCMVLRHTCSTLRWFKIAIEKWSFAVNYFTCYKNNNNCDVQKLYMLNIHNYLTPFKNPSAICIHHLLWKNNNHQQVAWKGNKKVPANLPKMLPSRFHRKTPADHTVLNRVNLRHRASLIHNGIILWDETDDFFFVGRFCGRSHKVGW